MERVGVDAPAPLERPRGREWAAWRDIVVHVHRHVHRYLATCLHNRKQHVLWCRSRPSAQRAARGARRQATRAPRSVVKRTRRPARASMSTRASMLKRWKRPRTRSFTRRSEEHTSELQSRLHLVCRLLLEKKKNRQLN